MLVTSQSNKDQSSVNKTNKHPSPVQQPNTSHQSNNQSPVISQTNRHQSSVKQTNNNHQSNKQTPVIIQTNKHQSSVKQTNTTAAISGMWKNWRLFRLQSSISTGQFICFQGEMFSLTLYQARICLGILGSFIVWNTVADFLNVKKRSHNDNFVPKHLPQRNA